MKKGFTLVELLAVIVILAIIALIVTPVVNNIITSARTSANARSVEGHIRNVELAIMQEGFTKETGDLTAYDMTDGSIPSSIIDRIPNNDSIFCMKYTIENGTVLSASDCVSNINNWNKAYSYSNTLGAKVTGSNNINLTLIAPTSTDTHKGIVYMDPTDLTVECTSSSTLTTTNTGCKKFYVFNDEGNTYKMIMDRNTTAKVSWITKNDYINAGGTEEDWSAVKYTILGYDKSTVKAKLLLDTAGWIGNPRLITANEIAAIVEKENWTSSTATMYELFYFGSKDKTLYKSQTAAQKAVQQSYHWLFDYTNGCTSQGCNTADSSTYGYWTSDAVSGSTSGVWNVYYIGSLSSYSAYTASSYGVRPVLEIPKSLLKG